MVTHKKTSRAAINRERVRKGKGVSFCLWYNLTPLPAQTQHSPWDVSEKKLCACLRGGRGGELAGVCSAIFRTQFHSLKTTGKRLGTSCWTFFIKISRVETTKSYVNSNLRNFPGFLINELDSLNRITQHTKHHPQRDVVYQFSNWAFRFSETTCLLITAHGEKKRQSCSDLLCWLSSLYK